MGVKHNTVSTAKHQKPLGVNKNKSMQGCCVLTAFPLASRYPEPSLVSSVILSSSSSDPSTLSNALVLAMGDFGEVGLIDLLVEFLPDTNDYLEG